jgi:prepilin-type N-terminal cleavage/methylation domain-containing protein
MTEKENEMRKQKGFSLIELLIVVAIILIIAAIAIPNLLRARIAANESSAVSSIRTMNTAQAAYQSTFPTVGYASTMAELGPGAASCAAGGPTSANACLIDNILASATTAGTAKSGYYFAVAAVANNALNTNYTFGGSAATFNTTGVRGFCSNEDFVLHFNASWNNAPQTTPATCYGWTTMQ